MKLKTFKVGRRRQYFSFGKSTMLTPYPTELPTEALAVLLDYLRGQSAPLPKVVHVGYVVAGYGLGQMLADNDAPELPKMASVRMGHLTHKQLADALESKVKCDEDEECSDPKDDEVEDAVKAKPVKAPAKAETADLSIPWAVLVPMVMQVLSDLLAKWLSGK